MRTVQQGSGSGDRNDQTRRHNLSTLLTLVHRAGPLSRAELTRRTGLNRSSIGTLVGELVSLGVAYEAAPVGAASVGRPSPSVHPGSDLVTLAVHPDIDAVTVGLVGLQGRILERRRYPVEAIPTVPQVVSIAADARADLLRANAPVRIVGAGVVVPGLIRTSDGWVTLAPHLQWEHEPLGTAMADALGTDVLVDNDAAAAASAEAVFGAGRGVSELIYTGGSASGIGGGVVSRGKALRGSAGYSGELGHLLVNHRGKQCFCGRRGCLETEVRRERLLRVLGLDDADADDLDQLLAADRRKAVTTEVARQLDWLASGLLSAMNAFNPTMIILGGFLGSLYGADPERLDRAIASGTFPAIATPVRITRAELGADLPLIGAAELALTPLLADPSLLHQI